MISARDGAQLACHCYFPETGSNTYGRLLFLHGGSFNSRRYANIAKACVKTGFEVVLCDLRGHGSSEGTPGTCDYVGQLEDDISDTISWFEQKQPLPLILGGHSSGSVVCLRYIVKYGQDKLSGCYFIAPAISNTLEPLRFDGPTSKRSFLMNYWRKKPSFHPAPKPTLKHIPKMNNGKFLLALALPLLRHRTVMSFPGSAKMAALEGRVLNYSFNLMASVSIPKYSKAFRQINVPIALICGELDEILHPSFLTTVAQWHLSPTLDKEVHMLAKLNHMSILSGAARVLPQWLAQRWTKPVMTQAQDEYLVGQTE
ncbi:alpha/beta hydrolase [Colwellia psychrerythraea]|nr:alpha/beta fold hydrolase [Colwellia psychrerythraea]